MNRSNIRSIILLSRPQVYASLARFERQGLAEVVEAERGEGPERKRYRITPDGVQLVSDWVYAAQEPGVFASSTLFARVAVALLSGRDPQQVLDGQRAVHLEHRQASGQIEDEQRATVRVGPRRVAAALVKVDAVRGLRATYAFPTLSSRCRATEPICVTAIVATCDQLRAISPGLQGCVDGKPLTLLPDWDVNRPPAALSPLRPMRHGAPVRGQGKLRVRVPRHAIGGDPDDFPDGSPGAQLEPIYADIALPPDTPGLAPLARRTERTLLVTADPGRTLDRDLDAAGLLSDSPADLGYYDFVASLRALVWAIAAVILSVGLLSFVLAAIAAAGAVVVGGLTVVASSPRISAEAIRRE